MIAQVQSARLPTLCTFRVFVQRGPQIGAPEENVSEKEVTIRCVWVSGRCTSAQPVSACEEFVTVDQALDFQEFGWRSGG